MHKLLMIGFLAVLVLGAGCTSQILKVTDYFDDGVTIVYLADETKATLLSAEKRTYDLTKEAERDDLRLRLAEVVPK